MRPGKIEYIWNVRSAIESCTYAMSATARERGASWVIALAVINVTLPACCALSITGTGNSLRKTNLTLSLFG